MENIWKIALCTLTLGLIGCDAAPNVEGSSRVDEIRSEKTLTVGYISYPPSLIVDPNSGDVSGIMAETLNAMSDNLKIDVNYAEEVTFATMIEAVESGRVDMVVSGIWPSSARALSADFSDPVYFSPVRAYVRTENGSFDGDVAALGSAKVRIATIDGELSSIIAATDFPSAQAIQLAQDTPISNLLLEVVNGRADVTFVEPVVAAQFLDANPDAIRPVADVAPIRVFPNTFLLPEGDYRLAEVVNVALEEVHNSGQVGRLLKRYAPEGTLVPVGSPGSND